MAKVPTTSLEMHQHNKMVLFARLVKVDATKREVWGVATAEMVDKEGEIFDYKSSKPYFKAWSDEISKATDGKSLGNVREMHEPSAVGKLVALQFADAEKEIRVGAKIVDEEAWQKCMEGVYTGFSIGGGYVKAWKDGEYVRFTANPVEISVVDNPCVPGAHFTAVKADGTCEVRKFADRARKALVHEDRCTVQKSMLDVGDLAYLIANISYLQGLIEDEAIWENDGSEIPEELAAWVKTGTDILRRLLDEEVAELTEGEKAVSVILRKALELGKAGAKHSAQTKAHHAAITKCMGKIAKAAADGQEHCDELMVGKDMEEAAQPDGVTKQVPAEPERKTEPQESTTMLEKNELEKLDTANANSASALSKIAEVEKSTNDRLTKIEAGQEAIGKSLVNIADALVKLSGMEEGGVQKVSRAAVPTVTVTKELDGGGTPEADLSKMSEKEKALHLAKKAHENPIPQRGFTSLQTGGR